MTPVKRKILDDDDDKRKQRRFSGCDMSDSAAGTTTTTTRGPEEEAGSARRGGRRTSTGNSTDERQAEVTQSAFHLKDTIMEHLKVRQCQAEKDMEERRAGEERQTAGRQQRATDQMT
eukprot:GHVU01182412.1.p3 GENE.GHVU01182412.1~~GHVU01182412.1.p3  ORF type:complete len:118 (+),score=29.36 GHVU01182412.1:307-660(+)